jgi:hypothetical protein
MSAFVFQLGLAIPPMPLLAALLILPSITVVTGLVLSFGVTNHSPLEILRAEG